MTEQEFQRLMLVYGAEIGRWPAHRQAAAERWLDVHPKARLALRRTAELDRLLAGAAPLIAVDRVDRAIETLSRVAAAMPHGRRKRRWLPAMPALLALPQWAPRGAMIYLGMFFLGCAANLAARLLVAVSPLDLWFSSNLTLPLGG